MARRLQWPPKRLDPNDSTTWPFDGQHVLVWKPALDGWVVQRFDTDDRGPFWSDLDDTGQWSEPTARDQWLALPPAPEAEA